MGAWCDLNAVHTAIAEAAVDPSGWKPALEKIALVTGSVGAALIPINTNDRPQGIAFTDSLAESTDVYIKDGWYKQDLRNQGIQKMHSTGITVDQDHTSPEEMRRAPYYNDFLGRYGLQWFAGVAFNAGEDNWCLSIQRSPQQGPFSAAEQQQLIALRTPMTTAATIARELRFALALGIPKHSI